jgi:hypothetical protein
MGWEYRSVRVHLEDFDAELTGWGKAGWELVSVVPEPKTGPWSTRRMTGENKETVVAFLKRPL